ncbi:apoptosis-stimulating of p53 protein 1-like isoform X2 [Argiope bruennichi]|uniref:Apoptosis-stimulating of p53 protein 1 like protein n=1 Tax=Argiope bruennichi TaxID=94029 RepID=A0A8T0DZV4_ARGBR|nr:apoptosis-stimulating of p53 protein 1-like isoform X2 [Argiope bruennichi]KAF8763355.1 Apoptosis-stimulating of p53 protein 1 like protein [Argiope bruennichi]
MVLLPEDAAMTLAELRQMAARQQHQIEAQQQLLVAKEQRLKFLKQQEARHHNLAEHQLDPACLQNLRDKIDTQEHKLRQLRALRGQVEQQKTNNDNLGTELDSIRALFCEKEKELNLAVNKVDELTRQLDEIRNNKNRKNCMVSSTASELENLRRELLYRTKLSEQQNNYICQQREDIALRQKDISILDKKINELTQRLHRKRLLNEQLASQIHNAALSRNYSGSVVNNGFYHATNVVAVEPLPRESLETEHARDDMSAKLHGSHKGDLGEFGLNKNDPKYQTLPYNTKFTSLKGKCDDSLSSSTEDDSWPNSLDSSSSTKKNPTPLSIVKPTSNMCNLTPRPFNNAYNTNNSVAKASIQQPSVKSEDLSTLDKDASTDSSTKENLDLKKQNHSNIIVSSQHPVPQPSITTPPVPEKPVEKPKPVNSRSAKPVVPPKPALPVKPMISNRQTASSKENEEEEKDLVNVALSVLQNKSSKSDKSATRYHQAKDTKNNPTPAKSKIATYFQKSSINKDSNSHQDYQKKETSEPSEIPKRKPSMGQLPIKPKPLTIRKTPGLEPPKLKVQPVVNTNFHRKSSDSNLTSHFKASYLPHPSEEIPPSRTLKSLESSDKEGSVPVLEVAPLKKESEDLPEQVAAKTETDVWVKQESPVEHKEELVDNCDETDLYESQPDSEKPEPATETVGENESDDEKFHSAALRRMRKGNLKGENSSRGCRRVSFDPLALLLDAALEGELELVKKTANEVPNPSAANDEGITALHNAICAGHVDVVTFLVEFGCDVNAQDSDGWTPLHCAASCNNLPMVKFLVERGACIFATTLSDHETAAEKCEEDEEGFDGCSEYLYSLQENLGVMNNGIVYAVYDYEGQNADELSFKDGDMLTVLRKGDDEESEWWWSRLHDEEGYVPRNLLGLYPRVTSRKQQESTKPDE